VEPDRRSRKPAETIERAASRMRRLIDDLLEMPRLEAGQLSIERLRVSPGQLIADCVEAHVAIASSRSLQLALEVPGQLPDVWADHDRLLQVFENLIGNALKFTPSGGRVTVGAAARDAEVMFWVSDTGIGVAPEHMSRLFDRFWQARRNWREGAGLGLPIVKGIVEAHGGRIWAESELNRGSTFFFTIPAAAQAEAWQPEGAH
jgi:signal transduction histidine kinase